MTEQVALAENSQSSATWGKPFSKGVSGNPGGKPKALAEFRDKCRDHSDEAIETLLSVMRKDKAMSSAKVQAARVLLAYAFGAPANLDESQGSQLIINILKLAVGGEVIDATPAVTVNRLVTADA